MYKISELNIYPIKSLGGVTVQEAKLTRQGLQHDRRWMLVDAENRFITQRENHELALLQVSLSETHLKVEHKQTGESILIPFKCETQEEIVARIFDDVCLTQFVSKKADEWFSEILKEKCKLVYMPEKSLRYVDNRYAKNAEITSLSDGYPTLIIGEAALDKLNELLSEKIKMNRFRPNIVFTGGDAHDEDEMSHFSVNDIDFYGVKLCGRCVVPTVNQETGVTGKEPTRTMARYRVHNNKVYFGQNLLHQGDGTIKVGDEIKVLEKSKSPFSQLKAISYEL